MNKLSFKVFICIAILMFILCSQSMASNKKELLAKSSFKIDRAGEILNVIKFKMNEEVGITITNVLGEKLLDFSSLGVKEKLFTIDNKVKSLLIKDLTGDGIPEVVTTAYYGPASALYVFKYDEKSNEFVPIKFIYNNDVKMNKDYMVSDMPQDNGFDMTVLKNNQLRALGKIYPSDLGEKIKVGYYYFKLIDDCYKLINTETL